MIIDAFIFFNELEVLKIRLEELYPVVDRFIIVEMDHTFQGQPKPSNYEENQELYTQYADKISHVMIEAPQPNGNDPGRYPWDREYYQRNAIGTVLSKMSLSDDDIIIMGDADEIPRRAVVSKLDPQPVQSLALDAYYYGINISGGHKHTNRVARWGYAKNMTMQELRTLDPPPDVVYDGGWHFSYLGTPEHIVEKFKAFAHSELNRTDTTDPDTLRLRMKAHGDLWGDGHVYEAVEIDDTWPEAIKRDREYWSRYEW